MSPFIDDDRLSINDVAKALSVHPATVWRWTKQGARGRRLRTVQVGGRRFVLRGDLEQFVQADDVSMPSLTWQKRADIAGSLLDSLGVAPSNAKESRSEHSSRQK